MGHSLSLASYLFQPIMLLEAGICKRVIGELKLQIIIIKLLNCKKVSVKFYKIQRNIINVNESLRRENKNTESWCKE